MSYVGMSFVSPFVYTGTPGGRSLFHTKRPFYLPLSLFSWIEFSNGQFLMNGASFWKDPGKVQGKASGHVWIIPEDILGTVCYGPGGKSALKVRLTGLEEKWEMRRQGWLTPTSKSSHWRKAQKEVTYPWGAYTKWLLRSPGLVRMWKELTVNKLSFSEACWKLSLELG